MPSDNPIHWHQGLALQPHHLQHLQRRADDRLDRERWLARPYPYGVVDCRVADGPLAAGRLRFDALHVLLKSGLDVAVGQTASLPEDAAVNAKVAAIGAGQTLMVYLAVPLFDPAKPNVLDGASAERNRRYRVQTESVRDENTGGQPRDVQTRLLNARLVAGDPAGEDVELLPLVRLRLADGRPAGDPRFVPPIVLLSGWAPLREQIAALALSIDLARRRALADLGQGGYAFQTVPTPTQFESALRLAALNRCHARLTPLLAAPHAAPFDAYLELRTAAADLAALRPAEDHAAAVAEYDHDDLARTFGSVLGKVRELIVGPVAHAVERVPFVRDGRTAKAVLSDDHARRWAGFYLKVRAVAGGDAAALAQQMRSIRLAPYNMVQHAIAGIRLAVQLDAVPTLPPAGHGELYYKLDWTDELSGRIRLLIEQDRRKELVLWSEPDDVNARLSAELVMPAAV